MKQVKLRIYRTILPLLLGLFLSVSAYAQNITVKGNVKDATGELFLVINHTNEIFAFVGPIKV